MDCITVGEVKVLHHLSGVLVDFSITIELDSRNVCPLRRIVRVWAPLNALDIPDIAIHGNFSIPCLHDLIIASELNTVNPHRVLPVYWRIQKVLQVQIESVNI